MQRYTVLKVALTGLDFFFFLVVTVACWNHKYESVIGAEKTLVLLLILLNILLCVAHVHLDPSGKDRDLEMCIHLGYFLLDVIHVTTMCTLYLYSPVEHHPSDASLSSMLFWYSLLKIPAYIVLAFPPNERLESIRSIKKQPKPILRHTSEHLFSPTHANHDVV